MHHSILLASLAGIGAMAISTTIGEDLAIYEPELSIYPATVTPRAASSGKEIRDPLINPITEDLTSYPVALAAYPAGTTPRAMSDKERRVNIASTISEMLAYLPETIPEGTLSTPRAVPENQKRVNIGTTISEMLAYKPETLPETIPEATLSTPRAVSGKFGDISEMLAYIPALPIVSPAASAKKTRRNLSPQQFRA